MIGFSVTGWIVLCIAMACALWRLFDAGNNQFSQEFIPVYSVMFLLAGLLMLPFAPLATAPLALAKSRSN
jgi:hypothetical protein